ncbi:fimbrial protein [Pseudomonas sp. zjy_8]
MNAITTLKAAVALAMAVAAQGVLARDGTVIFNGSIVDAACVVATGSTNQTVELGRVSVNTLTAIGARSPGVSFSIKLTDCSVPTARRASVTFNAPRDPLNAGLMAVTGGAVGVGIQIYTEEGGQRGGVIPGNGSMAIPLRPGDSELQFYAAYVATRAQVEPGAANATAQFTVNYH